MKTITTILFLFIAIGMSAQNIRTEIGTTATQYMFTSSSGESLENLQSSSGMYLSLGVGLPLWKNQFFLVPQLSYETYRAVGSDVAQNSYFAWETDYGKLELNTEYTPKIGDGLHLVISAGAAAGFLLKGTQTLTNQTINLVGLEEFDNTAFFYQGGLGFRYAVSNSFSMQLGYRFQQSTILKEEKAQGTSELQFKTHKIGLSFLIDILQKDQQSDNQTNSQ